MLNQQTSYALKLVPDVPENPYRIRRIKAVEPEAISSGDEQALSWYFGQGLAVYDRSTFGAVLQRITLDGFSSGPCERCNGEGILDDGGFAVSTRCRHCDGKGTVGETPKECGDCRGSGAILPYEVRAKHGGWCDSCRGTGTTSMSRREQRRTRCSGCGPAWVRGGANRGERRKRLAAYRAARAQCAVCLGTGHEPYSASPVTKADSGSGVVVDDSALTKFAITSRRLSMVREQSPALYAALECYYGDVGARWGREEFGRLFALYALTPCGRKLSRWGTVKGTQLTPTPKAPTKWRNPKPLGSMPLGIPFKFEPKDPCAEMTAQERIGVQAILERTQPKRDRTVLLLSAKQQADELYKRAVAAWNRAQPGRADEGLKRLAKRFIAAGMVTAGTHLHLHAVGR